MDVVPVRSLLSSKVFLYRVTVSCKGPILDPFCSLQKINCVGMHFTFNISGYLLAGTIIVPILAMVQWAAVRTQRSDIRAAPHLKYSPSPVTKMFVIQGQLPGLASCPPVILLLVSCSAHSGLTPHDAK